MQVWEATQAVRAQSQCAPPVQAPTGPLLQCSLLQFLPCPHGDRARSSVHSAGLQTHPAAPGPPPAQWIAGLPRMLGHARLEFPGLKVHTSPAAKWPCANSRACDAHGDAPQVESGTRSARGICGSERAVPRSRASSVCRGHLQSLQSPSPASRPSLSIPSESAGGGSSFHNKSPARGSASRSRLEQAPRCWEGEGPTLPAG
jgi:hypothetical protein